MLLEANQARTFLYHLTVQGLMSPPLPPHPIVANNCCVSVFSKQCKDRTDNSVLMRPAHADTLAPRPRATA